MSKHFLSHNQGAKLGSLLVAVALWLFAVAGATRTSLFPGTIGLTLTNITDELIATPNVEGVRVRLAADPAVWRQLIPSSFAATLDLAGQAAGLAEVPVKLSISVPNVQVIEILPKTVEVQIEARATKQMPIEVKTEGDPASGLFASEATTDPATVTVRGGQSILNRLDRVTAVIDVGGATTQREETVNVQALDATGRAISGLTFTPAAVRVRQPLTKLAATKTVGIRVVTTGTPLAGKLVTPTATKPTIVTIAGSAAVISAVTAIPTKPINLTAINQPITVQTTLDPPGGITLIGGSAVDVSFDVTDHDASLAVNPKLVFTGLATDRRVQTVDPAAPSIVVRGAASRLAALASGDVTLTIDLAGQSAGSIVRELTASQVQLPEGISVQQVVTASITVIIQ